VRYCASQFQYARNDLHQRQAWWASNKTIVKLLRPN